MHLESPFQGNRHVDSLGMLQAIFQKVRQRFAEIGMGTILNDQARTFLGRKPTGPAPSRKSSCRDPSGPHGSRKAQSN